MARGKPGILSVGNRHEWPREEWGWLDWQREEEAQRRLKSLSRPPVQQSPFLCPGGFELNAKPTGRDARGRGVDAMLKKLGIRP
jgi:hypothetical protein